MSLRELHRRPGFWPWVIAILVLSGIGWNQQRLSTEADHDRSRQIARVAAVVGRLDAIVRTQTRDRSEARIASCIQENVQTQKNRTALVGGMNVLVSFASDPTPEQQTRIDAFLNAYTKQITVLLPYRDCSHEGIDDYFKHPPPDPARTEGTS